MTDDLPIPIDRPPGAADGAPEVPQNPFDAWLAEAPPAPDADLCPWCSARLAPPTVATCPSCGAHLRAIEAVEVPGVTVVDPEVASRRPRAPKPSGSAGMLAWLSGDTDLVNAAAGPEPASAPTDPGRPADAGGSGGAPEPLRAVDVTTALGTPGPDAVAPPDPRLRREMRRIGAEPDDAPDRDDAQEPRATGVAPTLDGSDPDVDAGSAIDDAGGAADGRTSDR